ncbi:hypothetical protein NQ315_016250 [Exocentrus adspersus]|uniref:Retrotransposon gag domain-containing protein n=1 Tax=Exocentrus adspersus TaxID=1586481 RepID=A0AAV8VK45_9CUCU|nr:hypothetical protein NQ315_016250 [Exocentrus adspersus]
MVLDLCNIVEPFIVAPSRTSALDVRTKVLTALNFYGYGSYQLNVGQNVNTAISQPSVPKFLEFSYESDDWEIYLERLDQHFTANNIGDEKIKTAILLSSIGQESYKLLRDLCIPDLPKTKAFEELCTLLNKQFGVHMSVWRERRKFHQLKQTDETITEWYAKIHSFSVHCKFGNNLNVFLKDKFVTGLTQGRVLNR